MAKKKAKNVENEENEENVENEQIKNINLQEENEEKVLFQLTQYAEQVDVYIKSYNKIINKYKFSYRTHSDFLFEIAKSNLMLKENKNLLNRITILTTKNVNMLSYNIQAQNVTEGIFLAKNIVAEPTDIYYTNNGIHHKSLNSDNIFCISKQDFLLKENIEARNSQRVVVVSQFLCKVR